MGTASATGAAFHPPDAFSYAGVRCGRLSAAQYRLLAALTDGPALRGFVSFHQIAVVVWADAVLPCDVTAALKELGRRLEDKLARAGVPLLLGRRDFAFRLVPLG
jgi:hypothetical protein